MRKVTLRSVVILLALLGTVVEVLAQKPREAEVHGQYVFTVGDEDNITLREAKHRCIDLARAEAIKAEFGEMVSSDAVDNMSQTNGETGASFFWENTVSMAKGDWLGDTRAPELQATFTDGKLVLTAEVWGRAREILQAETDLQIRILRENGDDREETTNFQSGDRFFVEFRSPVDGYVVIYLNELASDQTSCLLPYPNAGTGHFVVKGGRTYTFFEESLSPTSRKYYKLSTGLEVEDCQLVVIFSPNAFNKSNDVTGDKKHPNSLSTRDFQKWLLKSRRADSQMQLSKHWLKIRGKESLEK